MRLLDIICLVGGALATQFPLASPSQPHIVETNDDFQAFTSLHSPSHQIRIKQQNDTICNAQTSQYTGWLDISSTKHIFFWFFTSRSSPATDPLLLWLTGGPGSSSMIGLFGELGPCLINEHGNGTTHNAFAWNEDANVIFVDQPAGVGFSYVDGDEAVPGDSFTAARDMAVFMQMFTSQVFPSLQGREFHISGESYGGHYIPTLGAQIVEQNALYPKRTQINLKSVLIGNGHISPLDSAFGIWETLCTTKPGVKEPVFNSTRCDILATNIPRCIDLASVCYKHPDPAICAAAGQVCWDGVIVLYDGESKVGGRNRFDITAGCEVEEYCYASIGRIEKYLNKKKVLQAIGIPEGYDRFNLSSDPVAQAFGLTSDVEISTEPQVLELLNAGVHVLIYQGVLDLACNTAGNFRWANSMSWKGSMELLSKDLEPWKSNGEVAGQYKEVNIQLSEKIKSRFTFLTVAGAGHMVPMDKPKAALDMVRIWLKGGKFS